MTEDRNQSENRSATNAGRESALSIRRGWWLAYALIFSMQVMVWTILVVLEEVGYGGHSRPTEIAIAIGLKVGTLIVVSIAYTMILLEGVRSLMVISGYLEDKLNEKRRRDAARREAEEEQRKAEEEKRIAEAVETAVAEAVEVATAEATSQAHQAWADWNRHRLQAEEEGRPFDEPPPEFPQNIGEPK